MNVIVANRDPTENDMNYCFLWWNCENNKFFKFLHILEEKYIWEYLK